METSFKNKREEHCVHKIIFVMTVSKFIAAQSFCFFVKGALAHFRAERAWIFFFPVFKDNMTDICFYNRIWHFKFMAKFLYTGQIKAVKTEIYSNCFKFKSIWIKASETAQSVEQSETVFAAGDATGAPLQVSKAVGEGLIAALSACEYLDRNGSK